MKRIIFVTCVVFPFAFAVFMLVAGAQQPELLSARPQAEEPQRIAITYWATVEENAAYLYLCKMHREQNNMVLDSTMTYATNAGFQVFVGPLFRGWMEMQRANEHEASVRELAALMRQLDATQLRVLRATAKGMQPTNQPPSTPP